MFYDGNWVMSIATALQWSLETFHGSIDTMIARADRNNQGSHVKRSTFISGRGQRGAGHRNSTCFQEHTPHPLEWVNSCQNIQPLDSREGVQAAHCQGHSHTTGEGSDVGACSTTLSFPSSLLDRTEVVLGCNDHHSKWDDTACGTWKGWLGTTLHFEMRA